MKCNTADDSPTWITLLRSEASYAAVLCVLFWLQSASAQFVDVTAEVEVYHWHLEADQPWTIRCVVGTNNWQIESDYCRNCKATYWFNGQDIIEHTVVDRPLPPNSDMPPEFRFGPPIGSQSTRGYESLDGNPGMPVRVADRLCLLGRIGWLALCSGPCLKREGHEIFPPSDLWKELIRGNQFSEQVVTFEDSLGLPKSLDLYSADKKPVVQYRVTASTNVLGWEFPTEFFLAQYRPAPLPDQRNITVGTNGWELEFTAKGKIKRIGAGTKPQIPAEVVTAAELNYFRR